VSSVAAPSTSSSSGSAGLSAATAPAAGTTQIVPLGSTGQVAVLSNLPNATALTTAIQNNVRAATIQVQTTISATLNSLSLLNASALASSIRQQVSKGP
jgi:dihydrodipicolinate synthase/N-acetylneuraminate lyase